MQRIQGRLDEKESGYLQKISHASRQMGQLIDDLLVFSRMGRMEMIKTQIETRMLIDETIEELAPEFAGRNVAFEIEDLPEVFGDPAMLRLVFMNLLANAIKFTRTRETAKISVSGHADELSTVIAVKDNGVGFDPDYAHKLFGVFERLHSQSDFEGTGIGLANVKRIITRHGGRVWAHGALDAGAQFFFSLPQRERSFL